MLVEISLFTDSKCLHKLVNILGLLALALTNSLVVDVVRDLDNIATSHESTLTGGCLHEGREHPGFVRPLIQAAFQENIELIGGLLLVATASHLILFLLALEDKFE